MGNITELFTGKDDRFTPNGIRELEHFKRRRILAK